MHVVRVFSIPVMGDGETSAYVMDELLKIYREYVAAQAVKIRTPAGVINDVLIGTPAGELEHYIAQRNIDLVVMTSHGRGGVIRTALGSVTDRLIGGKAPVLIVRPNVDWPEGR